MPQGQLKPDERERNKPGQILVFSHAEGSSEQTFCASTLPAQVCALAPTRGLHAETPCSERACGEWPALPSHAKPHPPLSCSTPAWAARATARRWGRRRRRRCRQGSADSSLALSRQAQALGTCIHSRACLNMATPVPCFAAAGAPTDGCSAPPTCQPVKCTAGHQDGRCGAAGLPLAAHADGWRGAAARWRQRLWQRQQVRPVKR